MHIFVPVFEQEVVIRAHFLIVMKVILQNVPNFSCKFVTLFDSLKEIVIMFTLVILFTQNIITQIIHRWWNSTGVGRTITSSCGKSQVRVVAIFFVVEKIEGGYVFDFLFSRILTLFKSYVDQIIHENSK